MSGSVTIKDKKFKPLISEEKIKKAVKRLAESINTELVGEFPLFLPVLNGSFMFASDLLKQVTIPCEIAFIKLASYEGTGSTGNVREVIGVETDLSNRTVVIIEDIVDSGLTAESLVEQLKARHAGAVKIVTFLFKPQCCTKKIEPDYVGFEVTDQFVIGYGMDYKGQGRNLKEVHVLVE